MASILAITESNGIDRGGLFHKNGASVALVLEDRLVNYSAIYKDFFKWKEGKSQHPFPLGRILYDRGVIVIEPFDSPELVMKFLSRKVSRSRSLITEHKNLLRLASKKISTPKFTLPESVHYNKKPKYLLLTNLGENFKGKNLKWSRISQLGTIAGEFAARLYELDGTIHNDLHCGNLTQCPDGRIGIIDAESIRKTVMPEIMLRSPSMQKPPFAMNMARSFMVHSRIELCVLSAWQLMQPEYWPQMKYWVKSKPGFAQESLEKIDNNLSAIHLMIEQWEQDKELHPRDSEGKRKISCIPELPRPKPIETPKKAKLPEPIEQPKITEPPKEGAVIGIVAKEITERKPLSLGEELRMAERILELERSNGWGLFSEPLVFGRPPDVRSLFPLTRRLECLPYYNVRRELKQEKLRAKFFADDPA